MKKDFSRLTRPRNPMPSFVKDELIGPGLMEAYQLRISLSLYPELNKNRDNPLVMDVKVIRR